MSTKLVKNSQKKQQESTAAEVLQNLLEYLTVLFGIIMAGAAEKDPLSKNAA